MDRQCWIVVACRDHAANGVRGGFVQANHGKRAALDRMKPGDRVAVYSPREFFGKPGRLQAFTALGTVEPGEVWQDTSSPDFQPFRRRVRWEPVTDAPIAPLLERLDFIRSKKSYGAVFRFGVVRVPAPDFQVIERALGSAP